MKTLVTQKKLAAKVFDVGTGRILFDKLRLNDIAQAITREDIRDLAKEGVIKIRPVQGVRKLEKRKKRGTGSRRQFPSTRKQDYVKRIRKMRRFLLKLKNDKQISSKDHDRVRRLAKAGQFKSKRHLEEYIKGKKPIEEAVKGGK